MLISVADEGSIPSGDSMKCSKCNGKGYVQKTIPVYLIVGKIFFGLLGIKMIKPGKIAEVKKCPICNKNK